jgi:hypothetical protein
MPSATPRPQGSMSTATCNRLLKELASGQDDTNPQLTYSITSTTILLAISEGLIDPVQLAKAELANRGLDRNGIWVGFGRAREIHLGASTVGDDAAPQAAAEAAVVEITQHHLGLDTLETRNADALDFHDLAVWSIRKALIAAFESGARFTRDATNGQ